MGVLPQLSAVARKAPSLMALMPSWMKLSRNTAPADDLTSHLCPTPEIRLQAVRMGAATVPLDRAQPERIFRLDARHYRLALSVDPLCNHGAHTEAVAEPAPLQTDTLAGAATSG